MARSPWGRDLALYRRRDALMRSKHALVEMIRNGRDATNGMDGWICFLQVLDRAAQKRLPCIPGWFVRAFHGHSLRYCCIDKDESHHDEVPDAL